MNERKNCAACRPAGAEGCGQSGCGACCGGGCGTLPEALSPGERQLLELFGQLAFLPLVRHRESGLVTLLGTDLSESAGRLLLSLLQRRGLVRLDGDLPLTNYDYSAWGGAWERGSAALTAAGQDALDEL